MTNFKNDPKGGDNSSDNHLTIVVIVSGMPTTIKANIHQKLRAVAEKALEQTSNTGRPLQDWMLQTREEPVQTYNLDTTVEENQFSDGAELVMTLRAGEGG